jgi:RIO kinase 1
LEIEALERLLEEGWISEVIRPVKSGKEADVYMCRGGDRDGVPPLVAAKVYRATTDRGFRNDAVYRDEDERLVSRRIRVAMRRRTGFGREARFGLWVEREHVALERLHAAGARVPRVLVNIGGGLAMEWIGDEDGAAPPLRQARLSSEEAEATLEQLLEQVELFLALDLVHGDLSEYNVLWWDDRPIVIDFPQAVDPRFNRAALDLLRRDVANIARAFSRYGLTPDVHRITSDLWSRWLRGELRWVV